MTKPHNSKQNVEDLLADYTDRILATDNTVKQDEATFAADPDLRVLEQTALRLKNTFNNGDPEEEVIQRMHNRIIEMWQQGESKASQPFWQKWIKPSEQKWLSQHSRQRFSVALFLAILISLILISIPFMNTTSSSQPAASGQNMNTIVLIAFGGLILLALWLARRKP